MTFFFFFFFLSRHVDPRSVYNKHYRAVGQAKVIKSVERSTQNMHVAHTSQNLRNEFQQCRANIKGTLDVSYAFLGAELEFFVLEGQILILIY